MRAVLIILGLILLAAGIWVLLGHGSYQQTDTLVQIGSAKVTATHDTPISPQVGIAGIVVGAVIALIGFLRKG